MIVITAPTGLIGHQVLQNVLTGSEPVRVIVRDPSRLPAGTRDRVEIIEGSHADDATVDRAFAGADAVFWLPPPDRRASSLDAAYVDFARPAAAALTRHGVKRVVGISALGRGHARAGAAGHVTASLAMDDLIASSGVAYRALTMPSFMDNLMRQVAPIRAKGMFFHPGSPTATNPTCATRDIASVAATLLRDHRWTGVAEQPVLGPEDLSFDDMARILGDVLGTPVRCQPITTAQFRGSLVESGMSAPMADGMVAMYEAKEAGLDHVVTRTPETTTPTTFRQFCVDTLVPAIRG